MRRCLAELLRVTKPGGAIHLQCPDYRGSFEPHYRLPWLPLLPRPLAALHLRRHGRPTRGLDGIHYVTRPRLVRLIEGLAPLRPDCRLEIVDVNGLRVRQALARRGLPSLPGLQGVAALRRFARSLFRADLQVNLFVRLLPR